MAEFEAFNLCAFDTQQFILSFSGSLAGRKGLRKKRTRENLRVEKRL